MQLADRAHRFLKREALDPVQIGNHHIGRTAYARRTVDVDHMAQVEQVAQGFDAVGQSTAQIVAVEITHRTAMHLDRQTPVGLFQQGPVATQAIQVLVGLEVEHRGD